MNNKSLAFINILAYILLIPAAVWLGPTMWPENSVSYYFALNGAGLAIMNMMFLMEK